MPDCDCPPKKACPTGIPAWVLTFADLMSLLLAFFVLLFSFSSMDKAKYKQVAGSMHEAFGIQREIKIKEPPKGINIIAQEFSAGTPDKETLRNELRQHTTDDFRQYLKVPSQDSVKAMLEEEKRRLTVALASEIEKGFVEVDIVRNTIVIRILEQGSFASGSTMLIEPFQSLLNKIAITIRNHAGDIVVAGHSDSIPISNSHYRSNWELSASRAVTVVHELMQQGDIAQERFRLEGYGKTRPIDTNGTEEGRARNRRVEVTLLYATDIGAETEPEPSVAELPAENMLESDEADTDMIFIDPCPGCDGVDAGA